ncbi:MFS transporter [Pseudonocardia halophobica]|uniref:Metabolite transport protein YyaJ n=1 Tax=Pseudonocardia halophobica TaxID=29401 RepID=A0A9W6KZ32_9PSEU|nr:MFS transporter [Pseudonocardia halophobica]GLL09765.1 putative metabolite transport protein YyaJ [Pseudonocardia halophobica]
MSEENLDARKELAVEDLLPGRLDRLPILTREQRNWVAILGAFYVFDTVDLSLAAYTSAAWRLHWGTTVGQIGLITSATFVGMIVGGMVGGRLSDRYGRRPLILGGVVVMSAASLATAFAQNFETVALLRIVTGIGLQAMAGNVLVYASETLPAAFRGRYSAIIVALGFLAVPVAAVLSTVIVPLSDDSWRWMYAIGALGAVVALTVGRRLPESVRWLVANGRIEEADRIVTRLEAECVRRTGGALQAPIPSTAVRPMSLREVLTRRFLGRLLIAAAGAIGVILIQYGFSSWIPVLLVERGYTQTQALTYSTALAVAGAIGAFSTYLYIDRWQRKYVIAVIALLTACSVLVFGFTGSMPLFFAIGLLGMACVNAVMSVMYAYLPELFPTGVRGVGVGSAHGAGRIAGIVGSLIVPAIYAGYGFSAVYVYVAVISVLLAGVIGVFGARTTKEGID